MGNVRRRMLWPSILSDPHVQKLPLDGFKLFIGHILAADDEGRGDYGPEDWKSVVFPQDVDVTEERIEEDLLPMLWTIKKRKDRALVEPYEIGGRSYWYLPSWGDYQKVDHARASTSPSPLDGKRPAGVGGEAPGRPRNGAPPTPDQWELLAAMAEERETTILKVAAPLGLTEIDQILARDVTALRKALEEIKVASGKKTAAARVSKIVRSVSRAIQFADLLDLSGIFEGVSDADWPKARVGVLSISSEYVGSTKAELFESIRRSVE